MEKMEGKWHPIIDGDLSGIPRDKRLLFSVIDQGELYVDFGYLESILEKQAMIDVGDIGTLVKAKECVAWMEVPDPYRPGRCDICVHLEQWIDNFGDCWSKCKLLKKDDVFPRCPLDD